MNGDKTRLLKMSGLVGLGLAACVAIASPIDSATARRVADAQLPTFFAGPWVLADSYPLENLDGTNVAYTFVYSRPQKATDGRTKGRDPQLFLTQGRARLRGEGRTVTGNTTELYGAGEFASIVISADDTEPPVLRCFRGLPVELVKEEDALALAKQKRNGGAWHVSRRLMLGMFDEAFACMDPADTNTVVVVEMRSGSVATRSEARARKPRKQTGPNETERVRHCREAWRGLGVAVPDKVQAP